MTAQERHPSGGAGEVRPLNVVGSAGEPNPSVDELTDFFERLISHLEDRAQDNRDLSRSASSPSLQTAYRHRATALSSGAADVRRLIEDFMGGAP